MKSVDLSDNVDDDNVWQIELPCFQKEKKEARKGKERKPLLC